MFSLTFFQTHLLVAMTQIQLKLIAFHIIWYIIMVGWDIYTAPKTPDPEKLISRGIAIYSEGRKTKRDGDIIQQLRAMTYTQQMMQIFLQREHYISMFLWSS